MEDSKIEEDSTEVVNHHPGDVGGSRKLTMVSKYRSLGTLRSDDKMATRTSKNKKTIAKQQLCTCISPFLYISLPFLYDHDGKMPNLMVYGARQRRSDFISLSELGHGSWEFSSRRVRLPLTKQIGRNNRDED